MSAADDAQLRAQADSLRSTAIEVDQVRAELEAWWNGLTDAAACHEATLRGCTTQVGAKFFNGDKGDNGYSANHDNLRNFVDQIQRFLGQHSETLHTAVVELVEMEHINIDNFNSTRGMGR